MPSQGSYQICARCQKMFEKNKELYCPDCTKLNNKDYDLIINYLKERPGAAIMEIITQTGASLKSIRCFVEDGSMSYVGSSKNLDQIKINGRGGA